ncbi:MAG: protein jag [Spirochaetaceae bacterium]|jgi:spoIIIJ-associated protein|nr:protein jag [Spirochaetaceae bacterium]
MTYEFEGRTEKEAIDRAAEELGLEKDGFDVEILETQRAGFFRKGFVKIRVHTAGGAKKGTAGRGGIWTETETAGAGKPRDWPARPLYSGSPNAENDIEQQIIDFLENLAGHMGFHANVSVQFREERKLCLKIESDNSSVLIGKKGKNLDALQLLVNIFAGRHGHEGLRIILDSENYRIRREESLVRMAYTVADRVRESKSSILLEPMNPFDRRLIHTTLNDIADVETISEGEGLYKQVRVYYRGALWQEGARS